MKTTVVFFLSLLIAGGSAFGSQMNAKPGAPLDSVERTEATAAGLEITASGGRNASKCLVPQAVAAQIGYSIGELQMILTAQSVLITCEFTSAQGNTAAKIKINTY